MSNTTPSPSEILSALQSPYYGMVTLGLASQAYTAQNDWNEIPTGLYIALTQKDAKGNPYTPQLPGLGQAGATTPDPIPGAWSLDWGPANGQNGNGDNSNLLYVASYRASGNPNYKDGAPYFFAVAIRGTDTSVKGLPLDQQILQDIRDFVLVDWKNVLSGKKVPTPNTTDVSGIAGNVAHGTMLGFAKIANFTAPLNNGQPPRSATGTPVTVIEALNQLLAQYPGTPVVVTGHSLGAALTQLMASYLAWQLGSKTKYNVHVIPHCFAPPTAGDQGFVDSYQAACPGGSFWFNTFDFVPYAYITMPDTKESGLLWARENLWTAYQWPAGSVSPAGTNIGGKPGPALPTFIADAIDGFKPLLPKGFVRPGSGLMQLDGAIPQPQTTIEGLLQQLGGKWPQADPTDSTSQLAWQHFPPCYFGQMWGQYANQLAWFTVASYRPHPVS
jgi:hypothetical protein